MVFGDPALALYLNTLDLCLMGAMGITALIGLSRGFIRELSSIMAWILAGIATFWDIPILQALMKAHIASAFIADIVAALLVFVIAFAIVSLVGTICANFIRGTTVSPIDRLFGTLLGATKGFFLLSCTELVVNCFWPRQEMPEIVQKSFLMPPIVQLSDGIRSVLPREMQIFLNEFSGKNASVAFSSSLGSSPQLSLDRLPKLGRADQTESPTKERVEDLLAENLPSPLPETKTDDLKDLAMLAPKAPKEENVGGIYTRDQKETLNRMLDAKLTPEEEAPEQMAPFSKEAQNSEPTREF